MENFEIDPERFNGLVYIYRAVAFQWWLLSVLFCEYCFLKCFK
jgi:hypothetical protein